MDADETKVLDLARLLLLSGLEQKFYSVVVETYNRLDQLRKFANARPGQPSQQSESLIEPFLETLDEVWPAARKRLEAALRQAVTDEKERAKQKADSPSPTHLAQ